MNRITVTKSLHPDKECDKPPFLTFTISRKNKKGFEDALINNQKGLIEFFDDAIKVLKICKSETLKKIKSQS